MFERWQDASAINSIVIGFSEGVPAGMEIVRNFFGGHDANGGRKQRVERAEKFLRGEFGFCAEMRDLAEGVDACVGAAGSVNLDAFLRQALGDFD